MMVDWPGTFASWPIHLCMKKTESAFKQQTPLYFFDYLHFAYFQLSEASIKPWPKAKNQGRS